MPEGMGLEACVMNILAIGHATNLVLHESMKAHTAIEICLQTR